MTRKTSYNTRGLSGGPGLGPGGRGEGAARRASRCCSLWNPWSAASGAPRVYLHHHRIGNLEHKCLRMPWWPEGEEEGGEPVWPFSSSAAAVSSLGLSCAAAAARGGETTGGSQTRRNNVFRGPAARRRGSTPFTTLLIYSCASSSCAVLSKRWPVCQAAPCTPPSSSPFHRDPGLNFHWMMVRSAPPVETAKRFSLLKSTLVTWDECPP